MRHRPKMLLLVALSWLVGGVASAERYPTIATDGLYVGARLEPGGALSLGYDLDVYLTGDRLLSLGPAVEFAFLSEEGADDGQRQDWLLSADFLRFKVDMLGGDEEVRLVAFVGAGMYFASLPEQSTEPREVVLEDGSTATASVRYAGLDTYGALLSLGVGGDYFFTDWLGVTVGVALHIRLSDEERLPIAYGTLQAGLRFGL